MMADDDDDLLVTISGPALAFLLYENARSHDQIGFLLGEIFVYVTKTVTDSDRDVERIKKHIHIKTVVAYPLGEPFFNTTGVIHEEKLTNFIEDNAKKVVGWYHYRQEDRLAASLRDRIMHDDLSHYFSNINMLLPKDIFIFCILTSQVSDTGGTHKFKHILYRKESTSFKPVPLKINNLGADVTKPDATDYILTPKYSSRQPDAFDKVYEKIKHQLPGLSGVKAVTLIQKAAEHYLDKLIPDVTLSDKKVSALERQLSELRHKKFSIEYEQTILEHQMKQMEVDDTTADMTILDDTKSTKSDVVSEPKSPLSDIIDSPKVQATGSGTLTKLVRQQSRQESGGDRKRDSTSSERELALLSGNSPKSSYSEVSRFSPKDSGVGSSSSSILDRNRTTSTRTSTGTTSKLTPGAAHRSYASKVRQSPDQKNCDS